jgi:hypothetical protein
VEEEEEGMRNSSDDAVKLLAVPAEMRNIFAWKKKQVLQQKMQKKKRKAADEAVSQSGNVATELANVSEQEHDEDEDNPALGHSDDVDDQPFLPSPARIRKMKRLAKKRRKPSPRSNAGSAGGASRR